MGGVHIALIVLALVGLYLMYGKEDKPVDAAVEQETTEEIVDGLLDDFGDLAASYGY